MYLMVNKKCVRKKMMGLVMWLLFFSFPFITQAESKNSFYIIPDVDSRYLTEEDIYDMPAQVLNYAKNEVYARHGRQFKSIELQNYFQSQSWYEGRIPGDEFKESTYFNDFEDSNSKFLSAREKLLTGGSGYSLDSGNYSFQPIYDYLSSKGRFIDTGENSGQSNDTKNGRQEMNGIVQNDNLVIEEIPAPFQDFVKKYSILGKGPFYHIDQKMAIPEWCDKEGVLGAYVEDFNQDGIRECLMIYVAKNKAEDTSAGQHSIHVAVLGANGDTVKICYDMYLGSVDHFLASCDYRFYLKKMNDQLYIISNMISFFNGSTYGFTVFHVDSNNKIDIDLYMEGGTEGGEAYLIKEINPNASTREENIWDREFVSMLDNEFPIYASYEESSVIEEIYERELSPFGTHISLQSNMTGNECWTPKTDETLLELCGMYGKWQSSDNGVYSMEYSFFNNYSKG